MAELLKAQVPVAGGDRREEPSDNDEWSDVDPNDATSTLASPDLSEDHDSGVAAEPQSDTLNATQKALLARVASTPDDGDAAVKSKRPTKVTEPESADEASGKDSKARKDEQSLFQRQREIITLGAFTVLGIAEHLVCSLGAPLQGTTQDLQQITEAREALNEILDDLLPQESLESLNDPYTRLSVLIGICALQRYRLNSETAQGVAADVTGGQTTEELRGQL